MCFGLVAAVTMNIIISAKMHKPASFLPRLLEKRLLAMCPEIRFTGFILLFSNRMITLKARAGIKFIDKLMPEKKAKI